MSEQPLAKFAKLACDMGAVNAKIIAASSIGVAPWVLFKCRYGCEDYNRNLCCPPNTPTPKETQELIDCYEQALLFQCKPEKRPSEVIFDLEREIFLAGYYKAIGLGASRCKLCEECNLEKCIKPERARPAMEACGIDIFGTVKANGMQIEVLKDHSEIGNWYGLVLIE